MKVRVFLSATEEVVIDGANSLAEAEEAALREARKRGVAVFVEGSEIEEE